MFFQRGPRAAMLLSVAIALLSSAACGDNSSSKATSSTSTTAALLPRISLVPVSVVTEYFPDITQEASTGPNKTSVGAPIASRSVVYASADEKKKVTLSVDQYASKRDAAAAYQTAVQGSKAAPGFQAAASPNLGEEAFAGTSQVGTERHFGLGARDGTLIMSATHAGDIPVTPDNSKNLISLGRVELTTAKQALGSLGGDDDTTPAQVKGNGRVTIVYQVDAIQPESRPAMKKIMDSGVFERMADRLTKAVPLPHDLQVVITDNLPKGVDNPTTELDGRGIFWPAAFSKDPHDALTKFLPEVVRDKGAPKVIPQENFTADVLNMWATSSSLATSWVTLSSTR